jgi:hypothetical protein
LWFFSSLDNHLSLLQVMQNLCCFSKMSVGAIKVSQMSFLDCLTSLAQQVARPHFFNLNKKTTRQRAEQES